MFNGLKMVKDVEGIQGCSRILEEVLMGRGGMIEFEVMYVRVILSILTTSETTSSVIDSPYFLVRAVAIEQHFAKT